MDEQLDQLKQILADFVRDNQELAQEIGAEAVERMFFEQAFTSVPVPPLAANAGPAEIAERELALAIQEQAFELGAQIQLQSAEKAEAARSSAQRALDRIVNLGVTTLFTALRSRLGG